jgi:hypothetical protein
MGHKNTPRRGARLALALGAALLTTLLLTPAQALAAEETHFFNATMSLTGDCSTSTLDAVEDPGCPEGAHPPAGPFRRNEGVAVDKYGDRYVASHGPYDEELKEEGKDPTQNDARIDVFDPTGKFITEFGAGELEAGYIRQIAVDSEGNVYAQRLTPYEAKEHNGIYLYSPTVYKPASGEIAYGTPPVRVVSATGGEAPFAVDPANDHLFVREGTAGAEYISEYSSAATGNTLIDDTIGKVGGKGTLYFVYYIAIDAAHDRVYANGQDPEAAAPKPRLVRAFSLSSPHTEVLKLTGSTTPAGKFVSEPEFLPIAAEEETGHLFVAELALAKPKVYEFQEDGTLVSTIARTGMKLTIGPIAVDNGSLSPTQGYLFVPSGISAPGHSLAFEPKQVAKPPVVESVSVSAVTTEEATLRALVNPEGKPTAYRFEYTTEQAFEAEGFGGATLAGEGTIPASQEGIEVSANVAGLAPGTEYRFRAVAQSTAGSDELADAFATYGLTDESRECGNAALRAGASAALPDCRAYELVTPASTDGFAPVSVTSQFGIYFPTRMSSPDGNRVAFMIAGGTIPGLGGTGSRNGDPYLASRGADGWTTASAGPDGTETSNLLHGSVSPDQGFSFWTARDFGTAVVQPGNTGGERETTYVRYPDGHSELIGRGSIATDAQLEGNLISEDGGHIIFSSRYQNSSAGAVKLEPNAPPDGTVAIYDRTPDEVTHVISLLVASPNCCKSAGSVRATA